MSAANPSRLAFDDVVIDFDGRRVHRGGIEQPLEPKAFAVLALLAGAPGKVFTREEILDAVWGHRHITPGVLNRVVTLVRQALGEDAHRPRRLHTLHGIGYRFELPASTATQEEPAATAGAPSPAAAEPGHHANDGVPPSRLRLRAFAWLLPVMALVAVIAVIAVFGWRAWPDAPSADPPAPSPATRSAVPTLVVMPLKAIGVGEGARVIADGLSEELIGSLARIDGLRVIARESTRLAAAETDDPARLVQRLGITHALEGSLQQAGQSLRVRLRLVDAHGGGALWTKDFDRDASEILLLQREIAEAVAASLALKLGLAAPVAKSGDAEFLRRYLAAVALANRRDLPVEESTDLAESEFRALLRERPDDARLHMSLAWALEIRATRKPPLADALREEAQREAAIAMRLDPALPDPYAFQGQAVCRANAWERCLQLLAKARALAPGDAGFGTHIIVLARLGYLDRAEALQRELVARDPLIPMRRFWLARILDTRGAHAEARAELQRADRFPSAYARWFNAVWRGDHAEALRVAEHDIGAPEHPDSYAPRLAPGYILASRALRDPSLWPQAIAEFEKFERSTDLWNFGRVVAPAAPAHAATFIRELDEVRKRGYSSWDLLLWTKELAWLRRDPAFQHYLRDSGILAYWRKHGFPAQCRPQGEIAVCD